MKNRITGNALLDELHRSHGELYDDPLYQAAQMRVMGMSWDSVAKELETEPDDIQRLTVAENDRWKKLLRDAEKSIFREIGWETMFMLRRLMRSSSEKTQLTALTTYMRFWSGVIRHQPKGSRRMDNPFDLAPVTGPMPEGPMSDAVEFKHQVDRMSDKHAASFLRHSAEYAVECETRGPRPEPASYYNSEIGAFTSFNEPLNDTPEKPAPEQPIQPDSHSLILNRVVGVCLSVIVLWWAGLSVQSQALGETGQLDELSDLHANSRSESLKCDIQKSGNSGDWMSTTNIAGYQFATLTELKPLRERLFALCRDRKLKGTILLSTEGINLFVAGASDSVEELLNEIRNVPGLERFEVKYSESDEQPFSRMLVKIKKEIIAFGIPGVDPARKPAPKISARELKQWLDEKRPITLLDTRNDYEVALGTFENAQTFDIKHFRHFPNAVRQLPEEMKQQPIVMFCTGGIRCEKAGPFMVNEGYQNIFQLDGGILKYFEECGGDHYRGECFVFDKRVGLDAHLEESGKVQCYVCQSPLSEAEQDDPRFVEGVTCPYCYRSNDELYAQTLAERQEAIRQATTPLPGSVPYENLRPLKIPGAYAGRTMLDFLCAVLGHVSREDWAAECERGLMLDGQHRPVGAGHLLRDGERYYHKLAMMAEPEVNANIRILQEDEAIIAIHKPAPLPIHPCGRFNKNTLVNILHTVYAPQKPRPAHRLDANTTGVVVFTRTSHFAKQLQPQFERGEVEKQYLARIQGHPTNDQFTCNAPISDTAGVCGSYVVDEVNGLPALTDFRVLQRFANGTSLLEVRPHTGRTNQIRVHLWHLGFPILGDSLYLPGQQLGGKQTHDLDDSPLCLHAYRLTFTHPLTKQRMTIEAPPPDWAARGGIIA